MWYVAGVIRAAQQAHVPAPDWLLRSLLGALFVAVALWLIPDKGSALLVTVLGLPLLALGGAIAGWRTAWFAVPLGAWVMLGAYSATKCADCGGGGEEAAPPALIYAGLTILLALVGTAGAGIARIPRAGRLPGYGASVPLAVFLGVLFVGLVALRLHDQRGRNGEVLFERSGINYRAGHPLSEPATSIDHAASSEGIDQTVWLGENYGGFNLSGVQQGQGSLVLVYGRCGPAPCAPPVTVMMRRTCGEPPEVTHARTAPTARDGVVYVDDPIGATVPNGKKVIWTGHTEVTIYSQFPDAPGAAPVFESVQRLDGQALAPAVNGC